MRSHLIPPQVELLICHQFMAVGAVSVNVDACSILTLWLVVKILI